MAFTLRNVDQIDTNMAQINAISLPPPRRLCFCQSLSVCLCVSKITQKVTDLSEILRECREWQKLQVIQFWG